jgi:hypothetical protein
MEKVYLLNKSILSEHGRIIVKYTMGVFKKIVDAESMMSHLDEQDAELRESTSRYYKEFIKKENGKVKEFICYEIQVYNLR